MTRPARGGLATARTYFCEQSRAVLSQYYQILGRMLYHIYKRLQLGLNNGRPRFAHEHGDCYCYRVATAQACNNGGRSLMFRAHPHFRPGNPGLFCFVSTFLSSASWTMLNNFPHQTTHVLDRVLLLRLGDVPVNAERNHGGTVTEDR